MSRQSWIIAAVAASPLTGCSSPPDAPPDNTAAVCAEYTTVTLQFSQESPEGRALSEAVARQYKGTGDKAQAQEALTAYNKAFGARLKSLADKATNLELKSALTRLGDAFSASGTDVTAINNVSRICPNPSPSP